MRGAGQPAVLKPGLFLALLAGCAPDGSPLPPPTPWGGGGEESGPEYPTCDGDPGPSVVELCSDDEDHVPLDDGTEYSIAVRPQGDITIFVPLWFGGVGGGEFAADLEILFHDLDGQQLGRRHNHDFLLPCEDDGTVAAHWLEVFFNRNGPIEEAYDGLEGVLSVSVVLPSGEAISDELSARLVVDD